MIRLKVVFDTPEQMAAVYNTFKPGLPINDPTRSALFIKHNVSGIRYTVWVSVARPEQWETVHINELLKTYRSTDRRSEGVGAEVRMSSVQPRHVVREPRHGDVSMLSSNLQATSGTAYSELIRTADQRARRQAEFQRQTEP